MSPDPIHGRSVIVTGAGSGFGRLACVRLGALGADVAAVDVNGTTAEDTVAEVEAAGGRAIAVACDVTDLSAMRRMADTVVEAFGAIDVLVNNAGVMPLAFFESHRRAAEAWDRAIDINFKGVLHGILAVYDQMIDQGRGHVVNISSIYGNQGTAGSGVYSATKAAVNVLSESLRVETQGRIKVTVVRPTGVPGTGLAAGVLDQNAMVGLVGQHADQFGSNLQQWLTGDPASPQRDPDDPRYWTITPEELVDQIVGVINLPWGVNVSDITVRATGEDYVN